MEGQVVIVTGANSGIGLGTAAVLASMGATVVLCCRSLQRGEAAKAQLPSAFKIDVMQLDLASVSSVHAFAKAFQDRYSQLNVLILNGGIARSFLGCDGFHLTADGFEEMVGVNFLGHFYLTLLLLPMLRASPSPRRVIAQTSVAAANTYPRGIDTQTWRARAPDFKDWAQYGQSKLALLLFIRYLQRREPSLLCLACHPGVVEGTALMHQPGSGLLEWLYSLFMFKLLAMKESDGCCNTVHLASASGGLQPGGFYFPVGRLVSWPWSWFSHAFQQIGALQVPWPMQTEYPALWDESVSALLEVGAAGL